MDDVTRQLRIETKPRLQPFFAARVNARAQSPAGSKLLRAYWIAVALISLVIIATLDWKAAAACAVAGTAFAMVEWRGVLRRIYPFLR